ncbi:MAG: sigma-54-dependent Fis family transcriptional regulator [Pirellulaceae bacterium]
MPHSRDLSRYELHPIAAEVTPKLLSLCAEAVDGASFAKEALAEIASVVESRWLALVRAERGKWHVLADFGKAAPLPLDLLADVLDDGAPTSNEQWAAAPLEENCQSGEALLLHMSGQDVGNQATTVDALAAMMAVALDVVRRRLAESRRVRRLDAILEIAAEWQMTQEMSLLLEKMAIASTRLLEAERASIFLWDKAAKILVGRPALGVENGELRIGDSVGVVGRVVQTGEACRVDADEPQAIDRSVDQKLSFRTRNLLCVPLFGSRNEVIGAFEVLNKSAGDFSDEDMQSLTELATHASIALQNTEQRTQLLRTRDQMAGEASRSVRMIGDCPAIQALRITVERVAKTDLAVLILGENGTGKEVVAQSIHYQSRRWNEPFVAVNCAALTETLLESELFGHEKGAFTDARETRIGKFESASGGTLFLDEIGDMSLGGQAKLLRVLEEKIVVRVGGSTPIPTNARVLAATNQNLAQLVREKRFREDLYFRLNVVTLELPPLRNRAEDVVTLAEFFLETFCRQARRRPMKFSANAKKRLVQHSWPGNVREMRNLMERIAYLGGNDVISSDELTFTASPSGESVDKSRLEQTLTDATRDFQIDYILQQIEIARGNMSEAARRMGLHRTNLYRKIHQLGMKVDDVTDG